MTENSRPRKTQSPAAASGSFQLTINVAARTIARPTILWRRSGSMPNWNATAITLSNTVAVRHETAVHEREGRGGQRDRRGRGEREATPGEMRQNEQQEGRDGEGQRLFGRVRSLRATTASTTTTTAPATTSASNAYRQKSGRTAFHT